MANPEMSDQMPDSPPNDDSPVAEASPAALPNETAQLQRLLAEAKDGEREARRALGVLASIIKHLPVGVTVQAEDGKPLFAGDKYAGLSQMALWAAGGILKHAPALCAITNPTTNSYKRLVPGYEAPVNLAYSSRNRSAGIRIPMYSPSPKLKRLEVRFPDPSCNGYLAFSALLMAALDGIENKIDPGQPLDEDIYGLSAKELAKVPSTPGSLEESLKALGKDHKFLLKGDVFTKDVIEMWIEYKTLNEVDVVRMRPHPMEFKLYFDI